MRPGSLAEGRVRSVLVRGVIKSRFILVRGVVEPRLSQSWGIGLRGGGFGSPAPSLAGSVV